MRVVVDKAQSRGYANHGWLKTHHTFSFANYYNPERVHFGMLPVDSAPFFCPGNWKKCVLRVYSPHKKEDMYTRSMA